jgi:hypothetical protein
MYLPRNSFALFLYVMLNIKTFQNRLFVGESNKEWISFLTKTYYCGHTIEGILFRRLLVPKNGFKRLQNDVKSGGIRSFSAFHAGNRGSNPRGDAINIIRQLDNNLIVYCVAINTYFQPYFQP